ncbi:head GIN domain-containing protein [Lutimonas zeaxanthinifaciens]|uniref:head GIN domain-containing protein n=1 Tax=Lutimonas zeaxanthinifaciens TaxID=3060215 RepID=UPI00265D4A17|nr:head GIN domain-containing protein [Lutimonas sp. YSD2104]WKK64831.1 head GIN domain-containing protein [Lutimonas sp. YSD2104]
MKNLILKSVIFTFVVVLSIGTGYSQKVKGNGKLIEKTRNVGNFDGVGVSGSFDVFLVKGQEGKIEINVEENLEPYLITEVKDGSLKIKWKKGVNIRTTKNTVLTVHFNDISGLALAGSGDIIGKDKIVTENLGLAIAGSGDIRISAEAQKIGAAISGSGDMELSGTSSNFDAKVAGSGDIDASDLKTEKADLKISGSGSIKAHIEKEILARISGSGDIKYKGNPSIEDVKVSGSGSISTY